MANIKGLVVAGATIVAAVGVYYGLNRLMPKQVEHGELPVKPADPEVVFSGTISQAEPAPGAPAPATAANAGTPPPTPAGVAPSVKQEPAPPAPAPAAPAEAPKNEAATVPEPAPATPAPPAETAAAPQPEPAPAPKEQPKKPAPKPTERAHKPAPAPAETAKPSPPAQASARWWGEPVQQNPNRLNLVFAGQAAGQNAIALMFSGSFTNPGVANVIHVYDDKGKPANGHWALSPNPKMLLFRGVKPGRYTLVLSPQLKDAQGKALGRRLSGPVYVQ